MRVVVTCFAVLTFLTGISSADEPSLSEEVPGHLKKLSLEELMNVEVTTVAKKPVKLEETPAAVSVITSEDIRRSGVTSLPEALRMATGVQVGRLDASRWAVGMRGSVDRLSVGMSALMDGRSVYTPLFAGVFWDVQDTLFEDIDRIEVIRGPGGTLWGANAVNGVINIITKSAKDTQGAYVSGGGGSEEHGFGGFRYGGRFGDSTYYRIYGKYFNRAGDFSHGTSNFDGWNMGRVGFRSDSDLKEGDMLTVQGDLYDGSAGQRLVNVTYSPPFGQLVQKDGDLSGGNLLGRWKHATGDDSELIVQTYYDQTFRRELNFQEQRNTYDLDLQHRFHLPWDQEVVWGLGYRLSLDDTHTIPTLRFVPASRDEHLFTGFVQDEIRFFEDRLRVTVGSKFERNYFSGFEIQPSGRLLWILTSEQVAWAAVTRALITPSRINRDFSEDALIDPRTPTFVRIIGDGNFDSQKTLAYELGYRIEPTKFLFFDLTAFYNRYTDLASFEPGTPFQESSPPPERQVIPIFFRNLLAGEGYGTELSANSTIFDWWRVNASYSYFQESLFKDKASHDPRPVSDLEGLSPHHQVFMRSLIDLPGRMEFDPWVRYVDNIRSAGRSIGSYLTLDVHLGWRPTDHLEVSAVGQNLAQSHHAEFRDGTLPLPPLVEAKRGGYGELTWRW